MGTRRLKALLEFDVTGEGDLKQVADHLKNVAKAGEEAGEGTKKAAKQTGWLEKNMAKLLTGGALLAVGRQLLAFGQASITAASDVEEMQSKFDTVFKSLSGEVTNELQAFADAANRSVYDLQGFAATLQDTFVPLGFARDEAAKTSIEIVKLAEDLASFNNLNTEDVVRDLQSALVGNTETLRKYGVVANQAAIDQEALALGLDFTKGSMDAQTKAAAILSLTMKGTTDAQGDAIKTADSYANSTKGLEAAMTDLKVVLGQELLPVMGQLKQAAAGAVSAITSDIKTQNALTEAYQSGIITYKEWLDLSRESRKEGGLNAETNRDYAEVVRELEERQEALNSRVHDFNQASRDQIALVQMSAAEVRALTDARVAASGVDEEFADKQLQLAAAQSTYNERLREGIVVSAGSAEATAAHVERVSQLQELLATLPSQKDVAVDLQVYGINTLERAQALLNSIQGFQSGPGGADPYGGLTPGQTIGPGADPYAGQTGEAIDQGITPNSVKEAMNSSGYKQ